MQLNVSKLLVALLVVIGASAAEAFGQHRTSTTEPTASATPSSGTPHDFDFLIGRWNAAQEGAGTAIDTAKNFGGVAITEKWRAPNFTANDVTVFDVTTRLWTQTYFDSTGLFVQQTGGPDGDEIVLVGPMIPASGGQLLSRLRYMNISGRAFDQVFETSDDDGATWHVGFRLHFTKAR